MARARLTPQRSARAAPPRRVAGGKYVSMCISAVTSSGVPIDAIIVTAAARCRRYAWVPARTEVRAGVAAVDGEDLAGDVARTGTAQLGIPADSSG
jgi:hypothetical protein